MERNQKEMLEPCIVEWRDLLFNYIDCAKECKKLFPVNPPDPFRCIRLIDLLEDICDRVDEDEIAGTIMVRDHGIAAYNLPLVVVVGEDGEEHPLEDFSYYQLLTMSICVETKKKMTNEQILILLCFYLLYPLRVTRQKTRDSVAMLLNVLCQRAEMV